MCSCLFMVPTRNDSRTSSRSPQPTNGRLSASTCSAPSPVRIVLDTGVLVRANAKSTGPARELLTAILGGPHELITSAFLLDETARVLRYPRLLARHGLNEQEIEEPSIFCAGFRNLWTSSSKNRWYVIRTTTR